MASMGTFQHLFDRLPENPTLIELLASLDQVNSTKPMELSTFTEIFGELNFEEKTEASPTSVGGQNEPEEIESHNSRETEIKINKLESSPSFGSLLDLCGKEPETNSSKIKDSYVTKKVENLQLCTEGLGFESTDDVEDTKCIFTRDWNDVHEKKKIATVKHSADAKFPLRSENILQSVDISSETSRTRKTVASFPPPISSIGTTGKPCVSFRSYREDGRFVLKEIKIPAREMLLACREDGRLKLQFVKPKTEIEEQGGKGNNNEPKVQEEQEDDVNKTAGNNGKSRT